MYMKKEFEVPELTKISSKGQVVIPTEFRKKLGIKEGSIFAVSTKKNMIVLKKLDAKIDAEDLRTLKLVEEAWKDIEEGRFKKMPIDKFFKELEKWKR